MLQSLFIPSYDTHKIRAVHEKYFDKSRSFIGKIIDRK